MAGLGIGLLLGARGLALPSRPTFDAATRTARGRAPAGALVTVCVNGLASGTTTANAGGRWTFVFASAPAGGQTLTARAEVTSPGLKLAPVAGGGPATLKAIGGYASVPVAALPVSGAKTRMKVRQISIVRRAITRIGVVHVNAVLQGGASGVANGANALVIRKGAFEKVGGATVPITWGGVAADVALPAGALKHVSDIVDFVASPGDQVAWRAEYDIPAGGSYPVTNWNLAAGDQLMVYDPANEVDDVHATGPMAVPSGAATNGRAFYPALLVGLTGDGNWSVIGIGTSIDAGQTCEVPNQQTGVGGGYLARAAMARQRPYMGYALNGYQYNAIIGRHDLLDGLLEFFDEAVLGAPTNDLYNQGQSSIASIVSRWNTVAGYCRAGGIKRVHGATMLPRGTVTDRAVLAANFTPYADYAGGALRDQFNVAAKEKGPAFSNFDDVIDVSAAVEQPGDKNRWLELPYASTLAAAAASGAGSVSLVDPPRAYASLAFDPFNAKGQFGPSNVFVARTVTGSGPYAASTSAVSMIGVAQDVGNAVRERVSDSGTHPTELVTALMAAPVAAALS